jgi:hypothetical protein
LTADVGRFVGCLQRDNGTRGATSTPFILESLVEISSAMPSLK